MRVESNSNIAFKKSDGDGKIFEKLKNKIGQPWLKNKEQGGELNEACIYTTRVAD